MKVTNNIKNKLFVILFFAFLLIPNLVLFSGLESHITDNENLKFKDFPELNIKNPKQSLSDFNSYYLGNFGLKKTAVNQYISFKTNFLDEVPLPIYNVTGKDGWYFLGNHYNNAFNNTFGITDTKKVKSITNYLETVNQYLSSKNIKFYVVFPPNKHTIYSEYLPFQVKKSPTLYNILKDNLEQNSSVQLIDLHSVLLKAKKENQVYYKTDSHWNDLGAFIGYQKIMDQINNSLLVEKQKLEDYNIYNTQKTIGDNTQMINLRQKTDVVIFEKKTTSKVEVIANDQKFIHFKNEDKPYKLMVYRDSFTNALIPFFNDTFGDTFYVRGININKQTIENNKPDIVILELVERNIDYLSTALLN
ncbi:MAG: hypothetical protein JXK08_00860 [Flavobacteriaceae bacterium]|nr:hypothetical protein [Flavobacteriaceae bacterium]